MTNPDKIFTEQFGSFVCEDEFITAEYDGFTLRAVSKRDDITGEAPWDRDEDGHGPVSDWTTRAKRPGERILSTDGRSRRLYDFAVAVAKAKAEGWDTPPYQTGTAGERAVRAVERDYAVLKAWLNDEWDYCGICVEVSRDGVVLCGKYEHALWGIERNYPAPEGETPNTYLTEVANELAGEALDDARAKLVELAKGTLVESLASYVSADDATLDRSAFLRRVADRITEDLEGDTKGEES